MEEMWVHIYCELSELWILHLFKTVSYTYWSLWTRSKEIILPGFCSRCTEQTKIILNYVTKKSTAVLRESELSAYKDTTFSFTTEYSFHYRCFPIILYPKIHRIYWLFTHAKIHDWMHLKLAWILFCLSCWHKKYFRNSSLFTQLPCKEKDTSGLFSRKETR